jgi:hypothetical protein
VASRSYDSLLRIVSGPQSGKGLRESARLQSGQMRQCSRRPARPYATRWYLAFQAIPAREKPDYCHITASFFYACVETQGIIDQEALIYDSQQI